MLVYIPMIWSHCRRCLDTKCKNSKWMLYYYHLNMMQLVLLCIYLCVYFWMYCVDSYLMYPVFLITSLASSDGRGSPPDGPVGLGVTFGTPPLPRSHARHPHPGSPPHWQRGATPTAVRWGEGSSSMYLFSFFLFLISTVIDIFIKTLDRQVRLSSFSLLFLFPHSPHPLPPTRFQALLSVTCPSRPPSLVPCQQRISSRPCSRHKVPSCRYRDWPWNSSGSITITTTPSPRTSTTGNNPLLSFVVTIYIMHWSNNVLSIFPMKKNALNWKWLVID